MTAGAQPSADLAADPGLQLQRTVLSWRRLAASMTVASLVFVRVSLGHPALTVIATVVLIASIAIWLVVLRRGRTLRLATAGLPDARLPAAVAAVLSLAALAILIAYLTT